MSGILLGLLGLFCWWWRSHYWHLPSDTDCLHVFHPEAIQPCLNMLLMQIWSCSKLVAAWRRMGDWNMHCQCWWCHNHLRRQAWGAHKNHLMFEIWGTSIRKATTEERLKFLPSCAQTVWTWMPGSLMECIRNKSIRLICGLAMDALSG